MGKSIKSGLVFGVLGGIWAALHTVLLLSRSLPRADGYIIPWSLAGLFSFTDFGKFVFNILSGRESIVLPSGPISWGLWIIPNGLYGLAVMVISVVGSVIVIKTLNPNFRFKLFLRSTPLWRLIFCAILTVGLLILSASLFGIILGLFGFGGANELLYHYWHGLPTFVIAFGLLGCGIWFVWSDKGVAGNFSVIHLWELKQGLPLLRDGALAGAFAGAAFYLFLLLRRSYSQQFIAFRYQPYIPWMVPVFIWFLFLTSVISFLFGVLLHQIGAVRSWRRILNSLGFALCVGALLGLLTAVFFRTVWMRGYDYEKEMVEVLRLPEEAIESPKTVVLFGDNEYRMGTKEFLYSRWSGFDPIALNKAGVDAAQRFMESRNYRTFLAGQMNAYVDQYYEKNWQITPLLRYYQQAFEAGDDLRACLHLLFSLLGRLPTSERKRMLVLLTDESKYLITGGACHLLGDIHAHMGDSAKAGSWYELGKERGHDAGHTFPVSLVSDGVLQGSILVDGNPASRLRIGLVGEYQRIRMRRSEPEYYETLPEHLDAYVIEATEPDPYGNFRFENLVDDYYFLAIMADTLLIYPTWERVSLSNAPGKITIDPEHVVVDLGVIRIDTRP